MARSVVLESQRDFHLAGLLLMIAAVILGVTLTMAAFLLEQERRAAEQSALAAPAAAVVPAPAAKAEAAPVQAAAAVQASAPVVAAPAAPAAAQSASGTGEAGAGKTAFTTMCGACHPNGQAGLGPAVSGIAGDRVKTIVRQGKGTMPAFAAAQLSDQQLLDIVAFLGALGVMPVAPAGAPAPAQAPAAVQAPSAPVAPVSAPAAPAQPVGQAPASAVQAPAPPAPAQAQAAPAQPAVSAPAPAAPVPAASGDAAAGKSTFTSLCGACHPNGLAGLGPTLKGVPADTIRTIVRDGKGMMPAFGTGQVSDGQLSNMIAYLSSL